MPTYVLHNEATGQTTGNTTQQQRLYMNTALADEAQLGQYSTDVQGVTGRHAQPFSTDLPIAADLLTSKNLTRFVDWSIQTTRVETLAGRAVLRLWVARADTGTSPVSITASLYRGTSSSTELVRTNIVTSSVSVARLGCAGFQEVFVPLDIPSPTSTVKNGWFGVRVAAVGNHAVRFAYDVPSTSTRPYPASLVVGQK